METNQESFWNLEEACDWESEPAGEVEVPEGQDPAEWGRWFWMKARQHKPAFQLTAQNRPVYARLLAYFSGNRRLCASYGIDLQKGLWITGPEECGKSTIMEFFSHNAFVPFGVISSRQIVRQFLREGYPVLDRYGERSFQPIYAGAAVEFDRTRPLTWCFDELGMELPSQICGQPLQVLSEILLDRYELFLQHGMTTHVVTHLSAEEVELRYGKRTTARLKEMCNRIDFPADTPDLRNSP